MEKILGLNYPDLVKASFPLCGGIMNTTQGTCGGLTGGTLVIGYLYGRSNKEFEKTMFNGKSLYLAKNFLINLSKNIIVLGAKIFRLKLWGEVLIYGIKKKESLLRMQVGIKINAQ